MKSREKIAIEQYNQALYSYYQRYLEAVEQVENALVAISTYREETTRYKNLIISNARIAAMTSALYNNGLSAYLDVIDAYLLHLFINGFTTVDVYAVGDYDLNGKAFEEA